MKYFIRSIIGGVGLSMLCPAATATAAADTEGQAPAVPPGVFKRKNEALRSQDPQFFTTDSARRVGDRVLQFQRVTGGWPKNTDMCSPLTPAMADTLRAQYHREWDSTIDNDATLMQLAYLARLYKATRDERYRDSFRRGVEFLLAGQYPNGGWPQFWPVNRDYQIHITYNDNAMAGTMWVLADMMYGAEPYDDPGLLPEGGRRRLMEAFYRGVECILATQIRDAQGRPTVWCQQHYRDTYAPAPARAYELPSYCSSESAGILSLLMRIPNPDVRVRRAVHSAMAWLDDHKITGYRMERTVEGGQPDARLVADAGAPPLWARFYDLENAQPYVCDRDGVPRERLDQIGVERRCGYGWYQDSPARIYPVYREWALRWDPSGLLDLRLDTPGANQRGTMRVEGHY